MTASAKELAESHLFVEHGDYKQASQVLRACSLQNPGLQILAELGYVLEMQGLFKEAYNVFRNGLECSKNGDEDELLSIQVQMSMCLIEPVMSCNFDGVVERAHLLYKAFLDLPRSLYLHRYAVRYLYIYN
jgi:hypothetical protein